MGRFDGNVVLVTGASRGIGRAIALRFGAEGARVAVNHPGEAAAACAVVEAIRAQGGAAISVRADVAKARQVERMVATVLKRFGRIDVLVNNVGICPFCDFFDIDEQTWDRTHDVNLKGVFLCSQAVARHMVAARIPGRIISISSLSAFLSGRQQVHYCPSKAGVNMLMRSLAIVLGRYGITCNSVLPGAVQTDINRAYLADPEWRRVWEQRVPVGRLGEPEDVAGPVLFLASDDARYVSGAELLVDGGSFANF